MGFMKFLDDVVFGKGKEKIEKAEPVDPQGLDGDDANAEIKKLIASGRKIEAIKLVRQIHGYGLKEAKHMVDQMARKNS